MATHTNTNNQYGAGRYEMRQKMMNKIKNELDDFPDYVREYIDVLSLSKSELTTLSYFKIVKDLLCFIDDEDIKDITLDEIVNRAIPYLKIKIYKVTTTGLQPTAATSRNKYRAALNSFFRWLKLKKYIEHNPIEEVGYVRENDNRKKDFLSKEEVKKLLNGIKQSDEPTALRDYTLFSIMLITGLRLGAVTCANINDLDITNDACTLTVVEKESKIRNYDLTPLKDTIEQYLKQRKLQYSTTNALFINRKGTRLDDINYIVKKYTKKYVERELSPHKLRATFAVAFYEETKDLEKTRQAMGHENINTTQVYLSNYTMDSKEITEISSKLFL